ncbi:MAG: hypothetical protein RL172_482 [Bacteroidota bacterium]
MKRFFFCTAFILQLLGAVSAQFYFSGKVTNAAGIGLAGVNISKQQQVLAVTDSAGFFNVSTTQTSSLLQFSYVGYHTRNILLKNTQPIQLVLEPASQLLEETIVKAFEGNSTLRQQPLSVSVLNKAAIAFNDQTSLVPILSNLPGVKMDERSPGSYRLSVRGNLLRSPFGVRNVKVYWNGIPFTDANSNTYLNLIDINTVDRIEVIRGPGGSMYGAGTAGVVLLDSKAPAANQQLYTISLGGGSYGQATAGIAYNSSNQHNCSGIRLQHLQSDGWRNHTAMRRDVLHYSGSYRLSNKQTIHALLLYSNLWYQTPGGLNPTQLQQNPRQSRPASSTLPGAESQQAAIFNKTVYAGLSGVNQFSNHFSATIAVYTAGTQFKNPSILNYQRKAEQGYGSRLLLKYTAATITLNAGAEYQYGFTNSKTYNNEQGIAGLLRLDDEIAATQLNLFAQAVIAVCKTVSLTAGISFNNFKYDFTRLSQLPVKQVVQTFSPVLVPRIALQKSIGQRVSVYAAVSKGYSPPGIDEVVPSTGVFNQTLKAEYATNYEAGAKAVLLPGKLFAEIACYLYLLKNTIVVKRDAAGADYFINAGNTRQQGIEATVKYQVFYQPAHAITSVTAWLNYTGVNARFKNYQPLNNNYNGNRVTGTVPAMLNAGLSAATAIGWYANTSLSYTGKMPLNDANSFTAAPYTLLFLKLGCKKQAGNSILIDFFGAWNHSFNNPYSLGNDLNAAGNRFYNPAAPNTFSAGINIQLNK